MKMKSRGKGKKNKRIFYDKGNTFITVKGSDTCRILKFKTKRVNEFRPLETNRKLFYKVFCKKVHLKEGKVWRKIFSNKGIITFVTQGLPSFSLRRPLFIPRMLFPFHIYDVNAIFTYQKNKSKIYQSPKSI